MGLSGLQQGGPSVVVVFLVSGSWEREVILRDLGGWFTPLLGRVSEHANEPLPTSHFQILKHLRGEGQNFLDWKLPWWGWDGSFPSLGQKRRTATSSPLAGGWSSGRTGHQAQPWVLGAAASQMPPVLGQQNPHQPSPEFRYLDVWTLKECNWIRLFFYFKALCIDGQGFHLVQCGAPFPPPPPPYSAADVFFLGNIGLTFPWPG